MKNIKCERRVYANKFNTHSHFFAQLILPLHGKLSIETNFKNLSLDDNHLFFIPPDCEHKFRSKDTNEFLVLDIPDHMILRSNMDLIPGGGEFFLDERWKAIRLLILNEINSKENNESLNRLFHYFYKFICEKNVPKSVEYINEHFYENINLKTLAEIEHYNISYYSEWFKKNMDISPMEYIQKLRVKKAKELLEETDYTILQIAQIVGYSHQSSLTRSFKEIEKKTPVNFRKNIRR